MHNYHGGNITMTGSWQRIAATPPSATRQFNVRSASSNSAIYLSGDGTDANISGYITATESRQFLNTAPESVYFKGTAGNVLYWDVSE